MATGNLLIVDDEPLLLKRLTMNLEEFADKVFTAQNGLEALIVLAKEDIHCVVCDINMPKMNGVELIKKIRADKNEVPFIFYTGHGNRELMLEAARCGAFDFLNKPDLEGLEEVVTRGLFEGFEKPEKQEQNEVAMSDYKKLLAEIDS